MSAVKEITWRQAERLVGHRVDRRRAYARDGRQLLDLCRYTSSCSGCFEAGEMGAFANDYPWDERAQCRVGAGCRECGYSGKVRASHWVPHIKPEAGRA